MQEGREPKVMIVSNIAWIFYFKNKNVTFDEMKVGKWMYFFDDRKFIERICTEAIEKNIVQECKHSNNDQGVSCFYLNDDDLEGHKRVIQFFLENGMIKHTKTGRLYNISFKHDTQTHAGIYGSDYHSNIQLRQFMDLNTGEWKL